MDGGPRSDVTKTESYLDAEELAQQLAESLRALEVSVIGYREATGEIAGMTAATERLARDIERLGATSAQALDAIVKLGGPQIARRLDVLDERMAVLESRLADVAEIGRRNEASLSSQCSVLEEMRGVQQDAAIIRKRAFLTLLAVLVLVVVGLFLQLSG